IPAVPKTVPIKYETGETCEMGEIFLSVFSTTCVFSICYESPAGNESYLRSQRSIAYSRLILSPTRSQGNAKTARHCQAAAAYQPKSEMPNSSPLEFENPPRQEKRSAPT